MGRQARIDYPGALHHVMVRGMERKKLFKDDIDRQEFLDRLEIVLENTGTRCIAFALMPNHIHLLLMTGTESISYAMQSLLVRYAAYFNRRYKRSGKLYQNRFKSILCDSDEYLLVLTRYIHLNPVRTNIVRNVRALDNYLWTSHASYMGITPYTWVQPGDVLARFGRRSKAARKLYGAYINEGLDEKEPLNLDGGGLVRSLGGLWEAVKASRSGIGELGDERILGSGDFVQSILDYADERERESSIKQREGWDFDQVRTHAARSVGIDAPEELMMRGRGNVRSQGRALLCKWLVVDLGKKQIEVAEQLSISRSSVGILVQRGRKLEVGLSVSLE